MLNDCGWIVDSGASSHMTWNRHVYSEYSELTIPQPVKLGDGRKVNANGKGTINVIEGQRGNPYSDRSLTCS